MTNLVTPIPQNSTKKPEPEIPAKVKVPDYASRLPKELAEAQAKFDRSLVAFCDGLNVDDLDRRVATDRGEAGIIPERIGDLLAHLFLHDIHHRGQVHAMLSGTTVEPPQLDEFLLDYDMRFRREEMKRLGLA